MAKEVSRKTVRTAIASTLEKVRVHECVQFGLEPQRDDEDPPWSAKWRYVERRLRHLQLPELLELAGRVQVVHESAELAHLLGLVGGSGARELENPHRPLTAAEPKHRQELAAYLDRCGEDDLNEQVLLPSFANSVFRLLRLGHKDKALNTARTCGCATRSRLSTSSTLASSQEGKFDASGVTKLDNGNVAEIHNQALMMLAHEIFDRQRMLVDQAGATRPEDVDRHSQKFR